MAIPSKRIVPPKAGDPSKQKSTHCHQYQERIYRQWIGSQQLIQFQVVVKETDLQIFAEQELKNIARNSVLTQRGYLEAFIDLYPDFRESLVPWSGPGVAPPIVSSMIVAGQKAGVGPMAAVAGAISEIVGGELLTHSRQVIIENGGDVFAKTDQAIIVGIFANDSPFNGRIGIKIAPDQMPLSICTSSASIGHSLSFGRADAACVLAGSGALADATATAVGNMVKTAGDIQSGIDFARNIVGVSGVVIIVGKKIGAWGELEIVPLMGKKG